MSDYRYVGQRFKDFTPVKRFAPYSRVEIVIDDDTVVAYGDKSGYTLQVACPWGTEAMAKRILDSIKGRAYQPYSGTDARLDPAVELGDALSVDGICVGMYQQSTSLGSGVSRICAPGAQEINHEYPYKSPVNRKFARQVKSLRTEIRLMDGQITAEVERLEASDKKLSGRIDISDREIAAKVSKTGGSNESFGWLMELSGHRWYANNKKVFEITAEGADILGRVTAISGIIGDCEIVNGKLQVPAANITGQLTVGQIAEKSVVVSSKTETEYYLSTSGESATGGSWSTTIPTWRANTYIWVRSKTTDTYNGGNKEIRYSPSENGAYDKNLTTANQAKVAADIAADDAFTAQNTADTAQTTANSAATAAQNAQTSANEAVSVSQTIYKSVAAGTSPGDPPATWVSDSTGSQNTWTNLRPVYDRNYPALYIATQKQTVGGVVSSTTPALDATTTVIDGANIITGSISANKIAVTDLNAFGATIGGWSLSATTIRKRGEGYDVYLQAPATPQSSYNAISVSWGGESKFYVTYGGYLFSKNAKITGEIIAEKGVIGGVKIENGTLSGIKDANIAVGGISGGSGGSIAGSSLTGWNVANSTLGSAKLDTAVYSALGGGTSFNNATNSDSETWPDYFRAGQLRSLGAISGGWLWVSSKVASVFNTPVSLNYPVTVRSTFSIADGNLYVGDKQVKLISTRISGTPITYLGVAE